MYTVAIHVTA